MLSLRLLTAGAAATCASVSATVQAQHPDTLPGVQMVNVDGRDVRVQVLGLDNRREGAAVVVFEAGATNSLAVWASVLTEIASIAPVVAYDRKQASVGRIGTARLLPRST